MEPRNGLLLVNLGTPSSPSVGDVRRYLAEFLGDPRVLTMQPLARWLLLHGVILRVRPRRSAAAYREIWTEEGSPLLVHGRALADAVAKRLEGVPVELAMRYGEPSIARGLERLEAQGVGSVLVVPLFPQHAEATTGSVRALVESLCEGRALEVEFVEDFFDAEGFVEAQAEVAREALADFAADHVLMSFHGLPEAQLRAADPSGRHCLASAGCCDRVGEVNRRCYRAQCFATARALARALALPAEGWSLGFQSRFGRGWIRPYTDEVLDELVAGGVKRLAVLCPAFVADCLETLEEIGLRERERFLAGGGEELRLVPCVNGSERFADALASWTRDPASRPQA